MKTDYIVGLAGEMIDNDRDRINLFKKIDKMIELDWSLPEEMENLKWMRKVVSTDPLSAITVGRRTLSTIKPKVFIQPLNDNVVTKRMANWNEQNLRLQLKQANKRSEYDVVGDICESSLRYGMTSTFTVPVKWQLKGTNSKRWIQSPNGFMVMVESPLNVYPRFSPLGLESVLHVKIMRARDAVSFYGKAANALKNDIDGETAELNVAVYDYWDEDYRVTFAGQLMRETSIPSSVNAKYKFFNDEMELPFMPWTIKKTGTSLSAKQDHGVRPTFAGIAHSDMWELQNISKTFAFSEALGYAASPRALVESYSDETLTQMIEYGDINKPVRLKPGERYEPLNPPTIDQNLLHILDRTSTEMDRITGMKNLASLDLPSGTAFATVNELIKAASSALDPAKELAEETLAGVFENMLKWSAHTEEDITAIGDGSSDDAGRQYRLKHEHIQPDAIDIEVELTAHVPTDRLQKINAATLMIKELGFSKARSYRELDEENPEEVMKERQQEMFDEVMYANELKGLSAQKDLEIQQKQMQMQMQAQQAMQAQQIKAQEKAQRQGGGMNPESESQARMANGGMPPTRTGNPRREAQSQAAKGRGFDTSRAGLSPNQVDPRGFTKEGSTGVDRKGNTI